MSILLLTRNKYKFTLDSIGEKTYIVEFTNDKLKNIWLVRPKPEQEKK
jgi:hypothetical protein